MQNLELSVSSFKEESVQIHKKFLVENQHCYCIKENAINAFTRLSVGKARRKTH